MRTKPGVDSLSFDDLYNNLRVFKSDVKGSTASSSSTQNVAFVSENTNSTNDVSTAYVNHEDLEQLDVFDLEEMDLKWRVAMISMRMKKFYKKTGHFAREYRTKGNQDSRRRDAWNSGNKDGRRSGKQEDSKALVTIDGEGADWTSHSKEEEDYALMACSSSGSDTEHKKLLAEAKKEKEDLKAKVEKWHNSSKNLGKLLNTQMSANDKFGLGYGDHRYDGILSYENEVLQSSQASESETQTSDFDTCESGSSVKTSESLPEPTVNKPKVVSQPKAWSDAPIIEEYETDSEYEHVSVPIEERETPSFANKQVKTPREKELIHT
ncbi:hypothetical protein Tco_1230469 [Tanacetum coccineum]